MPSNWLSTFTRPDSLSKNDYVRQKTQSRDVAYPYDKQTSYGKPIGTSQDGSSYTKNQTPVPPEPQNKKVKDIMPYGQYGKAWEEIGDVDYFKTLKLKNFFIFQDNEILKHDDDHVYAPDAENDLEI